MIRIGLKLAVSLLALALAACAGNGEGLDENGRPPSSGDPDGPLTADFASIQAHVFTPICTACHVGATAPQGLRLDEANSYALLVGVASTEVPALQRVNPGDPDDSYLIQKLEGTAAVGEQMPRGGPPLPQETIDVIRQWIIDGAQPAATASSGAAFDLVVAAPASGDIVNDAPKQIVLAFTQPLDATRADTTAVRLERLDDRSAGSGYSADGDATARSAAAAGDAEGRIVSADVFVPGSNPRAILIRPREPLADGRYRVLLDDRNGVGLSDLSGRRLPAALANVFGERVATEFEVEALR